MTFFFMATLGQGQYGICAGGGRKKKSRVIFSVQHTHDAKHKFREISMYASDMSKDFSLNTCCCEYMRLT